MAISSYKVFLMQKGSGDAWTKLIDIKDYPDLGGAPEMLDITTLSDKMRKYIPGIQETEPLAFTCNYTKEDYTAIEAIAGTEVDLAVWLGGTEEGDVLTPTGSDGKFSFKGIPSVYVTGKGVNEVVDMVVTIAPTTVITVA